MNSQCPFCHLPTNRIVHSNDLALALEDAFPVSPGHSLAVPKRHVASWFELTQAERLAIFELVDRLQSAMLERLRPSAFNIGINDGAAAGQTIPHVHIHVIPRYEGDQTDARGGVRWIFPDKAAYWERT